MDNYLIDNYKDIYELCIKCTGIYESELKSIKNAEGKNEDEIIFKTISLQYCLISKQDLYSIFTLYQNNQFLTPQILLRNILEHFITYIFIEQDPIKRAKQYFLSGIKRKKGILNWLIEKKILDVTDNYKDKINEYQKQYIENKIDIEKWPKELEERARCTGMLELYLLYRYLSLLSHPDSNNIDFFFEENNGVGIFNNFNKDNTVMTLFLALYMTNYLFAGLDENYSLNMEDIHIKLDNEIKQLITIRCSQR
ncbi:MAG: DUF5677 domain-containing protein [Bacteroidota bacterium]|nr:hypothetical protein [bacterium]MBU1873516.1 hypothetical protein [bacterium]